MSDEYYELEKISMDNIADKIDDMTPNNNSLSVLLKYEIMLKKFGEKSLGYKWMHVQDQYYYENIEYIFKIFEIIVLGMLAALTGGEFVWLFFSTGALSLFYIVSLSVQVVLIFLSSIVRGIREVKDYASIIENHRNTAIKFGLVNLYIQEKFSIEPNNNERFLKKITKKYSDLLENAPVIRKSTLNKYIKATGDGDIKKSFIIGGYDKIEIIIDKDIENTNVKIKKEDIDDKYKFEMQRWLQTT